MAKRGRPRKVVRPPKAWERQKQETQKAFNAFVLYRDMQNRAISRLARLMGKKSARSVEKLSTKYNWGERVKAWDAEMDRRLRELNTSDIQDMRKRHVNLGVGMQTAVVKDLRAWVHKIDKAAEAARDLAIKEGRDPEKAAHNPILKIVELVRLSEYGVNLERLSRGEPSEITKEQKEYDLSTLSVAELKELKALKAKIEK